MPKGNEVQQIPPEQGDRATQVFDGNAERGRAITGAALQAHLGPELVAEIHKIADEIFPPFESNSPAQEHVLNLAKSIYDLLSKESLGVSIDALDVARVFKRRQLLL